MSETISEIFGKCSVARTRVVGYKVSYRLGLCWKNFCLQKYLHCQPLFYEPRRGIPNEEPNVSENLREVNLKSFHKFLPSFEFTTKLQSSPCFLFLQTQSHQQLSWINPRRKKILFDCWTISSEQFFLALFSFFFEHEQKAKWSPFINW